MGGCDVARAIIALSSCACGLDFTGTLAYNNPLDICEIQNNFFKFEGNKITVHLHTNFGATTLHIATVQKGCLYMTGTGSQCKHRG